GCGPRGPRGRQEGPAVSLPRLRLDGDGRTQASGGADGPVARVGTCRLAAVERRAHLLPDRLPQSACRGAELDLELFDLSTRHPPDHRNGGGAAALLEPSGFCPPHLPPV